MIRHRLAAACACAAALTLAVLAVSSEALADEHSTIKLPGDHPRYAFEAEPHLIVGYGDPFFPNGLPGGGFRGTFHIANGFIKNINDSVGIGVGIDFATNGHLVVPVVLQWNFWLSNHWSVFGEPGLAVGGGGPNPTVGPALFLGGRYHFNDTVALTLRVGFPEIGIGVSFLL
ncbi:MAG TPA: hypothetical protein VGM06_26775 [Polyangiaceae bacterium]|jgi:hypothetical protein